MLKYVDTMITFSEVPDEVSLCVNISNCPCLCKGCHSSYLSDNVGKPLTCEEICRLIEKNKGISCVSLMGGDADHKEINGLAFYIKSIYEGLKVCWYSGREELDSDINVDNFDYIKLGPYKEECGPLNSRSTNQKFYKIENGKLIDITYRFWKKL